MCISLAFTSNKYPHLHKNANIVTFLDRFPSERTQTNIKTSLKALNALAANAMKDCTDNMTTEDS
jgi:c-di-AMP phosphodiesterase-like protein